jgi:VanZ family protein
MLRKVLLLINAYLPPILWAALIFFLSAQSYLPSFDDYFFDFLFKKGSHVFVYGILYVLVYRGVNLEKKSLKEKNWLGPFVICFIYALIDELHQMFTPGRIPAYRDIGYDLLGTSIAFLRIYRYI